MTARARKPIKHGTNTGWTRHSKRGDVALWNSGKLPRCQPCTKAHKNYVRENRAIRRKLLLRVSAARTMQAVA